jgi:hypothetical protein
VRGGAGKLYDFESMDKGRGQRHWSYYLVVNSAEVDWSLVVEEPVLR